ncbi:cobalt/nickel transport system permease protein [Tistlia consotensis]|uniref:Cobalt/nickel transport system permease protein n=1 Tax=Tistlia consotensis USBA 355 TaxID=560819 RepID=A0A1Y6C1L7_9PROT|nr:CbiQ family ECF transporter T component [Tistlia consotensis]SMF28977.1 cobalt/nickel transport system permease protein [Tistlia consotensis USBA 355]SNR91716.1 cobalt/nickel transport system permease protein [Tistlia consotensis]
MRLIDRHAQTSRYRHLPAAEKLIAATGAMAVALTAESFLVEAAVLAAAVALLTLGARVGPRDLWRAARVPVGFVLAGSLAQATSLSLHGGLPSLAWPVGSLEPAAFVALRSLACIAALLGLALTTPLADLLHLLRRGGLGRELGDIAFLMLRIIWVTLDCLTEGLRSQANRLGFVGYRRSLRSLGLLLAALLPRTLGRARRLETGLAARGYDGALCFLRQEQPVSALRLGMILGGLAALATLARLGA